MIQPTGFVLHRIRRRPPQEFALAVSQSPDLLLCALISSEFHMHLFFTTASLFDLAETFRKSNPRLVIKKTFSVHSIRAAHVNLKALRPLERLNPLLLTEIVSRLDRTRPIVNNCQFL